MESEMEIVKQEEEQESVSKQVINVGGWNDN